MSAVEPEEIFEIFDATNDVCLGQMPRKEVHRTGKYHRAVNVVLLNGEGDILVQKRADSKVICPSRWDISCAEHLQPGETYADAARRGLQEELNITQTDDFERIREPQLHCIDDDEKEIHDHEFTELYLATYNGDVKIDEVEVAEAKYIGAQVLLDWLQSSPDDFTPWALKDFRHYFQTNK
mmetsp:Transcript_19230/g.24300  ORF Transcript_19230/g.24300 Transcript_19230/m.24300 type:complete len:181 (-) Transcript_19230:201-743(-)